jgi:hypothetical protein
MCGKEGPADTVTMSGDTKSLTDLQVSDLYVCAAYLDIKVSRPSGNHLVYITNKDNQQISPYHNLLGYYALVPVSPSPVVGDEIMVHVLACGGDWDKFGPFAASTGTPSPPSFVTPIESGKSHVQVGSLHAGAIVGVYINDEWHGSAISNGNLAVTIVQLNYTLETDDEVFGTQALCGRTSKPSKKVKGKKPKPAKPKLLKPEDEAENVSMQPTFQWSDAGAGQEREAESFQLVLKTGNNTIIDTNVTGTPASKQHHITVPYQL